MWVSGWREKGKALGAGDSKPGAVDEDVSNSQLVVCCNGDTSVESHGTCSSRERTACFLNLAEE